ncbi:hypothetical protein E2562_000301 [Oryza meyeriana var. granulata]|uniref:Uncharacterized protein n=1 Tax=Oryza meyeriana var. granulata TaxID=110450 RepID=A0A6G1CMS2_9ORYZ|nr:hypothetical protein E2562_000301 [Oryza meyeriana var. granulata]
MDHNDTRAEGRTHGSAGTAWMPWGMGAEGVPFTREEVEVATPCFLDAPAHVTATVSPLPTVPLLG